MSCGPEAPSAPARARCSGASPAQAVCPLLPWLGHDCGVRMDRALPAPAVPCGHGEEQVLARWSKVLKTVLPVSQAPGREPAGPCLPGNPPRLQRSPPPVACVFSQRCSVLASGRGSAQEPFRSGLLQPCHFPGCDPSRLTKPAFGARASCAGSKGGVPGVEQNPALPGDGPVPVRSFLIVHLRAGVGALPGETVTLPVLPV